MEISTLQINGSNLDKEKLLQLIKNNRKLEAVKFIKATSRIALKDCKVIVDNLAENPDFYENDTVLISEGKQSRLKNKSGSVMPDRANKKGNHVISVGNSPSRKYIILIIAVIITLIIFLILK